MTEVALVLTSIKVEEEWVRCPRCSQPADKLGDMCPFCQWPLNDPGSECGLCHVVNARADEYCSHCGNYLTRE